MAIQIKTDEQIVGMRRAGLVVAAGLDAMVAAAREGGTTREIDEVAREVLAAHGATSNFLNYGAEYGTPFPGVACLSVNQELIHGIPNDRILQDGDVLSIDFGAVVDGWHGDAARTVIIGEPASQADQDLVDVTRGALWAGIAAMATATRVGDISKAIEGFVKRQPRRYGNLREYTGHGIGTEMHMAPDVPNVASRRPTARLQPGMVLAIEPMLTLGLHQTLTCEDDWTVISRDGSKGAHWEHTVAVTSKGLWVLTAADGGRAELASFGIDVAPLAD